MLGSVNTPGVDRSEFARVAELAEEAMAAVDETPAMVPATASQNGYMSKEYAEKLDGLDPYAIAYMQALMRQKSTVYDVGAIVYSNLPAGWYLKCTMGGTTDSDNLEIQSPAIGDEVIDGEVVWTICQGLVPAPSNPAGTTKYLREDGTWAVPPDNNTTYSTFVKSGSTAKAGLMPKPSTTAGTTKFLREDATWQVPLDTTYNNFVKSGSTAAAGLVPAPPTTAGTTKYLREDGTWTVPPDNNTTYSNFVKSGSSAAAGLVPKPSTTAGTAKYLREDATWATPPNTTYSNMTGASADAAGTAGLVPAPAKGKQASFLRGDGTWVVPTNTTYSVFVGSGSSAAAGLVPKPSTTAGTTKYLREDGTWTVPPDNNTDTKVTGTLTEPTSETSYYPLMSTGTSTSTGSAIKTTGYAFATLQGTTSAVGYSRLIAGNATATGTAGNKRGCLRLYNDGANYGQLYAHTGDTSNRTLYLPKAGGTLVSHTTDTAIGSASKPVYISASGVATACTSIDSSLYTNTTYSNFVKSGSSAAAGLVPKPSTTEGSTKFLCENATWAVPPGTSISASSIGANGYIKFSNGLIIQWGSVKGVETITFPIAFSSSMYAISFGEKYDAYQYGYDQITAVSKTDVTLFQNNSNLTQYWIAIGK